MKKLLYGFFFLFLFNYVIESQVNNNFNCGTNLTNIPPPPQTFKPYKTQNTAEFLKVLIVYITFADDNENGSQNFWPPHEKPKTPISNLPLIYPDKIVNPLIHPADRYPEYTYSDYFSEMSLGKFDFIGEEILVNLPEPANYYRDNLNTNNRAKLNQFILTNYVDPQIDFAAYDNWTSNIPAGRWDLGSDGNVEMIIMNYRYVPHVQNEPCWFWSDYTGLGQLTWDVSGEASLGNINSGLYYILDGKHIGNGLSYEGSGITAIGQKLNYSQVTQIVEHEFCHNFFLGTLFGVNHLPLGLMSWGIEETSYCMSPYERAKSEINYIPIIVPNPLLQFQDFELRDYVREGDVVKIKIPTSPNNNEEFFWIANHQKISPYDGISHGSSTCYAINGGWQYPACDVGKGIYIYHEINSSSCQGLTYCNGNNLDRKFDIVNADENYNWTISNTFSIPPYGDIPVFETTTGNRFYGEREYGRFLHANNGCGKQLLSINPCSNNWYWNFDYYGDGKDAFNTGYDEIFSPYSNPSSNSCSNPTTNSGITIRIMENLPSNVIKVRLYNDDLLAKTDCPPSKPKNLKISKYTINQQTGLFAPKLTWDLNNEPDFNGNNELPGYYRIYRGVQNDCSTEIEPTFYYITSVSQSTSEFIDYDTYLYPRRGGGGVCTYQYRSYSYKIEAVDNSNKVSLKSERGIINGYTDPCAPEDAPIFSNSELPNEFKIYNYPNPFNPSTQIKYEIPQNTFVTIRIYNILGEEVKLLVNNEYKNAGRYSQLFDGSNLASGIYYYSIEAGSYTDVKKMVLLK